MARRLLVLVILAALLTTGCPKRRDAAGPLSPGKHRFTLTHGGLARTYRAYVPKNAGGPLPVVFVFHGAGINGGWMMRIAGMEPIADRERFIAVFPDGARDKTPWILKWNAEQCCGYAMERNIDDVGFTVAVLDDISRRADVDRRRVYACGWSNGGMLSYRLACERPDLFAAVASVAGTLSVKTCNPSRPVPVLHIHGTADGIVPYKGPFNEMTQKIAPHQSVAQTTDAWRVADGCTDEFLDEALADAAEDGTTVSRRTWNKCAGGSEVVLYTIKNGGHTWPGRTSGLEYALGRVSMDLSASEAIWDFFKRHPMP